MARCKATWYVSRKTNKTVARPSWLRSSKIHSSRIVTELRGATILKQLNWRLVEQIVRQQFLVKLNFTVKLQTACDATKKIVARLTSSGVLSGAHLFFTAPPSQVDVWPFAISTTFISGRQKKIIVALRYYFRISYFHFAASFFQLRLQSENNMLRAGAISVHNLFGSKKMLHIAMWIIPFFWESAFNICCNCELQRCCQKREGWSWAT